MGLSTMTSRTEESGSHEALTREVIDLVQAAVEGAHLTADSTLLDLGLDSLKVMSLVFKIEERYGIELDDEDADELFTVGDLANLVVNCIREAS
jgi:acyl carrier protein